MAKKDGKKKKDKKGSGSADTVDAVRSAVERALPEGSKDRGAQIVDEVAKAVTKVRESLEQHGVFEELGKLRTEVEGLARRVGNLEKPSSTASTRSTPARKPAATRSRSTAAKASPAAGAAKKPAASRSRSTASRSTAAKKPATPRSSGSSRSRSSSSRSRTSGS
jgi:hypothetical protein